MDVYQVKLYSVQLLRVIVSETVAVYQVKLYSVQLLRVIASETVARLSS